MVKRIVANIATSDIQKAKTFYADILGLDILMDHGWITTYGTNQPMDVQLSFATQGGSGTLVPDLSIEVDNLEEVLDKCRISNLPVEYGPTNEPWGVRRFYVRDPFGKLINILSHTVN